MRRKLTSRTKERKQAIVEQVSSSLAPSSDQSARKTDACVTPTLGILRRKQETVEFRFVRWQKISAAAGLTRQHVRFMRLRVFTIFPQELRLHACHSRIPQCKHPPSKASDLTNVKFENLYRHNVTIAEQADVSRGIQQISTASPQFTTTVRGAMHGAIASRSASPNPALIDCRVGLYLRKNEKFCHRTTSFQQFNAPEYLKPINHGQQTSEKSKDMAKQTV